MGDPIVHFFFLFIYLEFYIRSIGAGYMTQYATIVPEVPNNAYDGLIFIDKTSAAIGFAGAESSRIKGKDLILIHYSIRLGFIAFVLFIVIYLRKRKAKGGDKKI